MSKFDQLINSWKEEIESINVNSISRKIESVDFFPMKSKSYQDSSEAWKVNFNFMDGIRGDDKKPSGNRDSWDIELIRVFTNKFGKGRLTYSGTNYGEIFFNNSKCQYMTYQGHRFIIQFYPEAFIKEIRNEKLEKLGIN